ncbi:MAG: hypothetical protein GY749_04840 [Desulfobacteraceae bacterium]|nr:hypothetical protein [Desulfobacteraceae bacterium]
MDILDSISKDDIFIIPIRLDNCEPTDQRLKSLNCADFSESYEKGLKQLMRVLTPEKSPDLQSIDSKISPARESLNEKTFINKLFDMFHTYKAVLLFAQEEREHARVHDNLMAHAETFFGKQRILHIVPPHGSNMNMESYFSMIGEQCRSADTITNHIGFMRLIQNKLDNSTRLLLLVSRFEQGNEQGGIELAGALRSLNEQYPKNLNILICGGEKLAEMYYCGGSLSLLNHAEVIQWPELTPDDICFLFPEKLLTAQIAEELLDLSGGHPRLIQESLGFCHPDSGFDQDECYDVILQSPFLWQLFTHFHKDETQCRNMCEMLNCEDICPYQPYIYDPLTRHLYWKNLLKRSKDGKRLIWRCSIIKEAGKQALKC